MARINRVWKMYLFFSFIIVMAMALAGFALQRELSVKLTEHLESEVLTLAKVLARALPDTDDLGVLTTWCDDYARVTGIRITVISKEGNVLGDSTEEKIVGGNHLDRPEVSRALEVGSSTTVRYSETSSNDMFYAALLAKEKGKIIRLSLPLTQVRAIENEVMAFFVVAIYLSPFLAVVLAFFFVKRVADESAIKRVV